MLKGIMNLPDKNRKWLKEVKLAYSKAETIAVRESIQKNEMYRIAPILVAENRGIDSQEVVDQMVQYSAQDVAQGERVDPGSENNHLFHFVSAYIHSHHVAGLMDEMQCDRVLEYINCEWELFPNA